MVLMKWWVEHDTVDCFGKHVQFRGWVNTQHESKVAIPCAISGKMWGWQDDAGVHGGFVLDNPKMSDEECHPGDEGVHGNFLLGGFFPVADENDLKNAWMGGGLDNYAYVKLNQSIPVSHACPRFETDIQSHIRMDLSYHMTL